MKSINNVLLAIFASLLLTAGLAKAAESFDVVGTSSQVCVSDGVTPIGPCTILH